jgi:hypothetical protein
LTARVGTSLSRVAGIARSLGDLSAEVVFIGGAIAPLLQTHPAIPVVRATSDVDAVVASTSYAKFDAVQKKLEFGGFKRDLSDPKHVHRWRAPDGTPFDLVPAGSHLGGAGNVWDNMAIETAIEAELEPGLMIRHASAPAFLALKWAAFRDRGAQDPFASHDWEDILALVISREDLVREFAGAPGKLKDHVWAIAASGRVDEGVSEIEAAIAVQRSSRAELNFTFGLRQLAETYMWQGALGKAQAAAEEGLQISEHHGERASLAELHRILGETFRALRRLRGGNAAPGGDELFARAESEFRKAIEEARSQSALLFELRASTGLGRLLEEKGRGEEMRKEVPRLRDSMTEGRELEDVRLANEFLDRISPRTRSTLQPMGGAVTERSPASP